MTLVLAALTIALSVPLCEPPEENWSTSAAERRRTMGLVVAASAHVGLDPRFAMAIGDRESRFHAHQRHRVDSWYSRRAYAASGYRYGWTVSWPSKARRAGDLEALLLEPRQDDPSASYEDPRPWVAGGLGVFGMVPANHVWRWDPEAEPDVLCDPVIAVIVLARLTTWAIREYGAVTWLDVHSVYAGRVKAGKTYSRPDRDQSFCARTRKWGLGCDERASSGTGWGPVDGQNEFADRIRGETLEAYAIRVYEERSA